MTKIKFELGKFYRTRGGLKAQIFMLDNGDGTMLGAYFFKNVWIGCAYFEKGTFLNISNHDFDIVGEWREPIRETFEAWINPECLSSIENFYTSSHRCKLCNTRVKSPSRSCPMILIKFALCMFFFATAQLCLQYIIDEIMNWRRKK